jgi:hypothetical protein
MKSQIITFKPSEDPKYSKGRLVLFDDLPIEACFVFRGTLMTKKGEHLAKQYCDDGRVIQNNLHEDIYVFIHEVEYKYIKEKENG